MLFFKCRREGPRRDPDWLHFPTVHIHDGQVHEVADFDHDLYYQKLGADKVNGWQKSGGPLQGYCNQSLALTAREACRLSQGILEESYPLYNKRLRGRFPNEDLVV